jgi:hypothetical protein
VTAAAIYRVFTQTPLRASVVDAAAHRSQSKIESSPARFSDSLLVRVRGSGAREATFMVTQRPRTEQDLSEAREAERRSRASGMSDLAARCSVVWEVAAERPAEGDEGLLLELCAVLAFAALGPVLPPDGAALFGVRGARERADRLLKR